MRRLSTSAALGWGAGWTARARALFRTDDDRFTDEEILTILRAGESGLKLADVCAAGGIRAVTYYDWRAKYSGLLPAGVRNRRLRARRKRRAGIAAVALLVVLSGGAAGKLAGTRHASQSPMPLANPPENLEPRPTGAGAIVTIPLPARAATAVQPADRRARATGVNAGDIETADPNGYVVQVAALPNLQEARAVLEQLAKAGYSVHLTAKIVDRVELYRVRVGPLKSRSLAEEVAQRLEGEGHHAPWVTR
jgi:cell division septation protein DedD